MERVCIESLEGQQPLRGVISVGDRLPLHCGASGKLLLAFLADEKADRIIAQKRLIKFTERTITDPIKLKRELRLIRGRQYAISRDERTYGVTSLATPLRDVTGKMIAALAISGPNIRFNRKRLPELVDLAKESADSISQKLGFGNSGRTFQPERGTLPL